MDWPGKPDPAPPPDLLDGVAFPNVPSQERSRKKRAAILAAAADRFGALGYQRTRIEDIAETADVSVGLLYRYFHSKAQIVRVLMADYVAGFADLGMDRVDYAGDPQIAVERQAMRLFALERAHAHVRASWETAVTVEDELIDAGAVIAAWMTSQVSAGVARGQYAGVFRADLDPATLTHAMLCMTAETPSEDDDGKRAAQLSSLFLDGARARR